VNKAKRKQLEAAGWKFGSIQEFLGLTEEEVQLIEMKVRLSGGVRSLRAELGITQTELAERLGSSQSRVAKIEGGDGSVSMELMVRALIAMGATARDVGRLLARKVP